MRLRSIIWAGLTKAIAAYRKALVLDPDYAVAMFNMAGVLWNHGDQE